jgi:predicted RNase H-like HicB family nuclease
MNELVFTVTQEADGGFVAEALGESIITQADSWEELRSNVREAVTAFYFDRPACGFILSATKCWREASGQ